MILEATASPIVSAVLISKIMDGADVGESKVDVSNAAILAELLEIKAMLAPLLPHIPAVVAMLDNPAARWRMRRNGRAGD